MILSFLFSFHSILYANLRKSHGINNEVCHDHTPKCIGCVQYGNFPSISNISNTDSGGLPQTFSHSSLQYPKQYLIENKNGFSSITIDSNGEGRNQNEPKRHLTRGENQKPNDSVWRKRQ